MSTSLLPILGSPGSPYTRKMLALLRFRRIPYRYIQGGHNVVSDLPEPKVKLIPVVYFADANGELEAQVDSTPIIRRLENEYPGRSVIPEDPVAAFLNYLLEDYADEWLTKAMFHYRWYYQADIDMAGSVLPHYGDVTQSDAAMAKARDVFSNRQISRLYVVGSNDNTAPVIEGSYQRMLACLNNHLKNYPYLLGARPCSADFAWLGQLTQLVQFDPTPAKFAAQRFPRVHAWVSKLEDLSGVEVAADGFLDLAVISTSLHALLSEIGRTYVPVMLANAAAVDQGLPSVETLVEGQPWQQEPFAYQAKCLHWIRIEYAKLDGPERARVDDLLAATGCAGLVSK